MQVTILQIVIYAIGFAVMPGGGFWRRVVAAAIIIIGARIGWDRDTQ